MMVRREHGDEEERSAELAVLVVHSENGVGSQNGVHADEDEDDTAPMLRTASGGAATSSTDDRRECRLVNDEMGVLPADDENVSREATGVRMEFAWAFAAFGIVSVAIAAAASGYDESNPLVNGDAPVLALLMLVLHLIFTASRSDLGICRRFFSIVPSILLCYFFPGLLVASGAISAHATALPHLASRVLLPSCLVLLTLGTDIRAVLRLGPKAIFVFAAGTLGIVIGGPLALLLVGSFVPSVRSSDETWRALATLAGSWIGGSANQIAMRELFQPPPHAFSQAVAADVACSNILMAFLLAAARMHDWIDERVLRAKDAASELDLLADELGKTARKARRIADFEDLSAMALAGFGTAGACAFVSVHIADALERTAPGLSSFSLTNPFFWTVVLATSCGIAASFTPVRRLEGAGASRLGSYLLYVLIATVGMQLDLHAVWQNPVVFLIGAVWLLIHAALILIAGRIARAPLFYIAVGSMANVGGAATAPVVASAFFPELAPVGALLAVLGYSLGTYAAWLTGSLLKLCHQATA